MKKKETLKKTTKKKRSIDSSQKTIRDYKPVKHEKIRKPKEYKQQKVPGTNKAADRKTAAKLPGWRTSATGNRYFERRENRSDTKKEQKYHGGVNRRAKPDSDEKTVKSRTKKTSKRLPAYRKLDKQKPRATTGSKKTNAATTRSKKPKTESQNINSIKKYENLIRNRKTEYVFALDDFGNLVFKNGDGEKNSCSVSGMPLDCSVMSHNHPGSSSFSGNDLAVAIERRAKVIRVCSEIYDYQLKPKNRFWMKLSVSGINDAAARTTSGDRIKAEYEKLKEKLKPKYVALFVSGCAKERREIFNRTRKLPSDEDVRRIEGEVGSKLWHEHSHEIITTMAEKYNWSYARIKRR